MNGWTMHVQNYAGSWIKRAGLKIFRTNGPGGSGRAGPDATGRAGPGLRILARAGV